MNHSCHAVDRQQSCSVLRRDATVLQYNSLDMCRNNFQLEVCVRTRPSSDVAGSQFAATTVQEGNLVKSGAVLYTVLEGPACTKICARAQLWPSHSGLDAVPSVASSQE